MAHSSPKNAYQHEETVEAMSVASLKTLKHAKTRRCPLHLRQHSAAAAHRCARHRARRRRPPPRAPPLPAQPACSQACAPSRPSLRPLTFERATASLPTPLRIAGTKYARRCAAARQTHRARVHATGRPALPLPQTASAQIS